MVSPAQDNSGSNLIPALRTRLAASRDNPPDAVGKLASCLIDCFIELRRVIRNQFFGEKKQDTLWMTDYIARGGSKPANKQ
jgi:hypothetical protein